MNNRQAKKRAKILLQEIIEACNSFEASFQSTLELPLMKAKDIEYITGFMYASDKVADIEIERFQFTIELDIVMYTDFVYYED